MFLNLFNPKNRFFLFTMLAVFIYVIYLVDVSVAFAAELDPDEILMNEAKKEYKFYKDWKFWAATTISVVVAILFFRGNPGEPGDPSPGSNNLPTTINDSLNEVVKPVTESNIVEVIQNSVDITPVVEVAQTSTEVIATAVVTAVTTVAAVSIAVPPEVSEEVITFVKKNSLFGDCFFIPIYLGFASVMENLLVIYDFFQYAFPESHKLYDYQIRTRGLWLYIVETIQGNNIATTTNFLNYNARAIRNSIYFDQINTYVKDVLVEQIKNFLNYIEGVINDIIETRRILEVEVIKKEFRSLYFSTAFDKYALDLPQGDRDKNEYFVFCSQVFMIDLYIIRLNNCLDEMYPTLIEVFKNEINKITILSLLRELVSITYDRVTNADTERNLGKKSQMTFIKLCEEHVNEKNENDIKPFTTTVMRINLIIDKINKNDVIVREVVDETPASPGASGGPGAATS